MHLEYTEKQSTTAHNPLADCTPRKKCVQSCTATTETDKDNCWGAKAVLKSQMSCTRFCRKIHRFQ